MDYCVKDIVEELMAAFREKYPSVESVTYVTNGLGTDYLVLSVGGHTRRLSFAPYYLDNRAYVLRLYDEADAIMLGFKHSLMKDVPKRKLRRRRCRS